MTLRQHIIDRHVDLDLHTVWLDEDERVATFPLWTLTGCFSGYQAYRCDSTKVQRNDEKGRYYTYRGNKLIPKHVKYVAVWGMESWYLSDTLFAVEGIFDAARLTQRGYSAVAVLSNDPSTSVRNWFRIVRATRPVVSVCDPGCAGNKLRTLGHTYHVVDVPDKPDADLGDAPSWYVDQLINEYV